ncbi:MAG: hypothetical protein WCK77_13325 [Verrucomicrobiota bacterium]
MIHAKNTAKIGRGIVTPSLVGPVSASAPGMANEVGTSANPVLAAASNFLPPPVGTLPEPPAITSSEPENTFAELSVRTKKTNKNK